MAKFGKLNESQVQAAYARFFGDMPPGTIFYDPLRGTNHLPAILKAQEPALKEFDAAIKNGASFGAATEHVRKTLALADWTLPLEPLREIFPQVFTETPVYGTTQRIAHNKKTIDLDRINTLGKAKWKGEGGTPDEGEDTYEAYQVSQKYAMTKGKTSGPMQVFGGAVRNVVQWDQGLKMTQVARLLEDTIVNGDPSLNAGDGDVGDANAFQGLRKTITATADATLDLDPAGADTVLSKANVRAVRKAIWKKGGVADLGITDGTTFDSFKATMEAEYGVSVVNPNPNLQAFGFENYTFDGMTIIKSDVMPDTDGQREFLVLDSRAYGFYTGLGMVMEPLAKTADADEYMVKTYGTLAIHQPKRIGRVKDLA